jgi:hypothetical protein
MKPHALAPLAVLVALCAAAPARAQVFGDATPLNTNAGLDAAAEAGSGQQVATDGQGTWVAVFATRSDLAGNGTDFDIAVARSLDGGVSWSAPAVLNGNAFGCRAYASSVIASESSRTFLVVSRFHRAIAIITIVASAVFLLCIMLLKVEERRLDAAVMRFVGVRRRTIFAALVLEAALVAVFGSVVGAGIALAAGAVTNAYYQRFFSTELVFSLISVRILLFGMALSLVLGLLAGAVAAWRLVRTPPMVLWGRA